MRIEQRRNDEQFRARLRQSIEDNQRILDRLARCVAWSYLDQADFLLIAEAVLDIAAEDLAHAGRLGLAESALHAPAATFGGVEF